MSVLLGTTLCLLVSGAAAAGHLFPDCENGPLASNTVCDTTASVSVRAKALVAAFTTEEKFQLVVSTSPGVPRLGLYSYEWWRELISIYNIFESYTDQRYRGGITRRC